MHIEVSRDEAHRDYDSVEQCKAQFVWAYVADSPSTVQKIKKEPEKGFPPNRKTADLPGGLSGGLCRFSCHWQRTILT
jgi:hypothetical protein